MNPAEYLDAIKTRLFTEPVVVQVEIRRERSTLTDAHMRARLGLVDGSSLEFSEYVQRLPNDEIVVVTYSYHWIDVEGTIIRRWDNTPHFPQLPGFPHHVHEGQEDVVLRADGVATKEAGPLGRPGGPAGGLGSHDRSHPVCVS